MLDTKKILEGIREKENDFFGSEEDNFEGGLFEENDDCAEWARSNVEGLFYTVRRLVAEVNKLEIDSDRLSVAEGLIYDSRSLLNNIHGYDTDVYREMGVFLYGEDEDDEEDDE